MSLTPIEEDDGARDGCSSVGGRRSGVRVLIESFFTTLARSWRVALGRLRDPADTAPQQSPSSRAGSQLRVSGQRQLESGTQRQQGSTTETNVLPDETKRRVERDEDSLRVYEPERTEAYIDSDTWEEVQR